MSTKATKAMMGVINMLIKNHPRKLLPCLLVYQATATDKIKYHIVLVYEFHGPALMAGRLTPALVFYLREAL